MGGYTASCHLWGLGIQPHTKQEVAGGSTQPPQARPGVCDGLWHGWAQQAEPSRLQRIGSLEEVLTRDFLSQSVKGLEPSQLLLTWVFSPSVPSSKAACRLCWAIQERSPDCLQDINPWGLLVFTFLSLFSLPASIQPNAHAES